MEAIIVNSSQFETSNPDRLNICYEMNLILYAITISDNKEELRANMEFIYDRDRITHFEYSYTDNQLTVHQKMNDFKNLLLYVKFKK